MCLLHEILTSRKPMNIDVKQFNRILDEAAADGRFALLEHEVYRFLEISGCSVPRWVLVPQGKQIDIQQLKELSGTSGQVMLKVVSPEIAHKTDVGGVVKVAAEPAMVMAAIKQMLQEVPERYARSLEQRPNHAPETYRGKQGKTLEEAIRQDIRGILIVERIPLEGDGPGSEVLFSLRHNREFGPVITMGVGGIDTELMGEICRKGVSVVSGSASLQNDQALLQIFQQTIAYKRLSGQTRTGQKLANDEAILKVIHGLRTIAEQWGHDSSNEEGWTVTELEVNPFGIAQGELVALDGLLKFRRRGQLPAPRPLTALTPTLRPNSLGIIGVSAKGMNMGRIILRNILEEGFNPARTYIIRPDSTEIDGVRCVPSAKDLPEKVDLFIVAVGADQVPNLMEELVTHDKAVGVILIPGGMSEKEGGSSIEMRIKTAIARARDEKKEVVAVGGNCLGILSRPGKYHTLFIPQNKLPLRPDGKGNVAFISQSGAYMISRMSKLSWMSPRYAISTGNQVDLTMSDFLHYLVDDREVQTFAIYVEGFQDGDGLSFARAVKAATAAGRDVIFYKAGRTAEGKSATSGHTASLAGDYDVCESIVHQAGAHVARNFVEFLDLIKLSSLLGNKAWRGGRLAALSNAGFEAVGIADNLRGEGWSLDIASLSEKTRNELKAMLVREKLDGLIDVRNPLDLTPMANDAAHEDAVRSFLGDENVDLVLCSTIPLTPAMATLSTGVPEEQSIRNPGSLVNRLARIIQEAKKPVVVSLDSGAIYDPMCQAFEEMGIPTFRSVDDTIRSMGLYLEMRLRSTKCQ